LPYLSESEIDTEKRIDQQLYDKATAITQKSIAQRSLDENNLLKNTQAYFQAKKPALFAKLDKNLSDIEKSASKLRGTIPVDDWKEFIKVYKSQSDETLEALIKAEESAAVATVN